MKKLGNLLFLLLILSGCTTLHQETVNTDAKMIEQTSTSSATKTPFSTKTPSPTLKPNPTATTTLIDCVEYFEAINPALIVEHSPNDTHYPAAGVGGVWSIILTKSKECPLSSFRNRNFSISANGKNIVSGIDMSDQIKTIGAVRLDYPLHDFPDSESFQIVVHDETGQELFSERVFNIAQTGIFRIPQFRNIQTGVTNPEVLESHEIRAYHVDSIVLPDETISSSFDISDVVGIDAQCSKPDGIHPDFIHWNAMDYGRCEWGPGSTSYEIAYMGVFPMKVRDVVNVKGDDVSATNISVTLDFAFELMPAPPLFIVEDSDGTLEIFYLILEYNHFPETFVEKGEIIQTGDIIGLIGKSDYRTELEEGRRLSIKEYGEIVPINEGELPFVPLKLTFSEAEGVWIEEIINDFNR